MGTMGAMMVQAMVDKFGSKETQQIIYPRLREMGKRMAAMAPQMGITGKDAIAIASFFHLVEKQVLKVEGEPTEVSPNKVVKEITKCPMQNLSLDYCMAWQGIVDGVTEGINPEYKSTLTKFIPRGDPVCQWIVQKK
jgi:hypothetical protein